MLRSTLASMLLFAATAPALASGRLDPDFDGDGVRFIDASPTSGVDAFQAGLIDAAGRYVAAGRANALDALGGNVMRFLASGQLDPSFGDAGQVRIPLVEGYGNILWADIVELPAGQLILAGRASSTPNINDPGRALVCRLRPDGTLDPSYGASGCALPELAPGSEDDRILAVALQGDGRLVLLGMTDAPGDAPLDYYVARLDADGSIDACFGDPGCQTGGVLIEPEPPVDVGNFVPYDLALAPDGRIVLAGAAQSDMALIRLLPTGSVDTGGFGNGGHRLIGFDQGGNDADEARAVVVRDDGSIVVTGTVRTDFGTLAGIAAVDAFGAPIIGFGTDGRRVYFFNDVSGGHTPTAMRLQEDGKLLVTGFTDNDPAVSPSFDDCGVARFLPDGQLDPVFGFSGVVTLDSSLGVDPTGPDVCYDLDADGRHILLFGQRAPSEAGNYNSLVMRLDQDGVFEDGFEAQD
jgi:uncharacterized delta-60 repeat protein